MMLLGLDEDAPAIVENGDGLGPFVFICEHASKNLPAKLGNLGLSADALHSHIAWDPGALDIARLLSNRFASPLVFQRYSRLAYDCNRPPEAPGAMPEKSEVFEIPGNVGLSAEEKSARTKEIYLPFHAEIAALIKRRRALGQDVKIVTIHSFTPVYFGNARKVEVGILHDLDSRMADIMLGSAEGNSAFDTRRNEPYGPQDGVTHTLILHGVSAGLKNVMIEVRNDLIADGEGQKRAANYLADLLEKTLEK